MDSKQQELAAEFVLLDDPAMELPADVIHGLWNGTHSSCVFYYPNGGCIGD